MINSLFCFLVFILIVFQAITDENGEYNGEYIDDLFTTETANKEIVWFKNN